MALLHLESLPPKTTKGTLVRLLTQLGQIDKRQIGRIELRGPAAAIEVPDRWAARLVRSLYGADLANRHIRAWSQDTAAAGGEEDHFDRLLRLLELEADAEARQLLEAQRRLSPAEAEQSGTSLIDLTVRDEQAGLGGRMLVTLAKRSQDGLPWTRLGIGAPVLLSAADSQDSWRGVVSSRTSTSIEIALTQPLPHGVRDAKLRLDLSYDEVARQRQRAALERARTASGDRLAHLRRIMLGELQPGIRRTTNAAIVGSLNASQADAVALATATEELALIHGPPGTGKTTTLVEVILQTVASGGKVLACAPSNIAVDNLFEKLLTSGATVVRLGHPARVLPELRAHTLDLIVDDHDDMKLARKLTRKAFTLFDRAARYTRAKPEPGQKRAMREEAKAMLADARRLERQITQLILDGADILCATLTGLDSELLGQRCFDLVVIDEACQTTEPACWIPLARSRRVVLAGDHCQLPPTVISREAANQGFAVSLFERLMSLLGDGLSQRLSQQYRMHASIMQFSSDQFYESSLIADATVRDHLLCHLPNVGENDFTSQPVEFIDTAGAGFDEELEPDGESRLNSREADLVRRQVEAVIEAGLAPADIAVIAPYAAQVRRLKEVLCRERLEIDTVDGFQGREKEAVFISLVRSNQHGEIGFLADTRRMNVALTRARRKLTVVGDSATIGAHLFYRQLIEYFEAIGAYHTVWEMPGFL